MRQMACQGAETWSFRPCLVVFSGTHARVAQLDRASGYEPEGREFESLRAHHSSRLKSTHPNSSFPGKPRPSPCIPTGAYPDFLLRAAGNDYVCGFPKGNRMKLINATNLDR